MAQGQSSTSGAPRGEVTEGGKAPSPKEPNGQIKPATSASVDADAETEGTSRATTAKSEKRHAEDVSESKPT